MTAGSGDPRRSWDGGQWNACSRGLPFLGFVIYPDRVRLGRKARQRLGRKVKQLHRDWRDDRIDEDELQTRSLSLFAHARFADDAAWRAAMLERSECYNGEDW